MLGSGRGNPLHSPPLGGGNVPGGGNIPDGGNIPSGGYGYGYFPYGLVPGGNVPGVAFLGGGYFPSGNVPGGGYGYGHIPQGQHQGPRVMPLIDARHEPLSFLANLHAISDNYLKLLPTYHAEKRRKTEEHLDSFQNFTDNFNIEHKDVYMRLFVQSLDRYV